MQQWQDEEWLAILGFLGGKEQGVVLSSLSHRFERLVMRSEQFLDVVLKMVDNEGVHRLNRHEATDLGRRADHDGVHWIDPIVQIGTAQTRALLSLVERTAYDDCSFHDLHHTYSDSRRAASAFCDRRGRYRLDCVKTASGATEADGFLFINRLHHMKVPEKVEALRETDTARWRQEVQPYFDKEWTQSRVPPQVIAVALRQLLQNTALDGRWSLVVCESKTEADTRAFIQAGFKQAEELVCRGDGNYLYAIPAFLDSPLLPGWVVSSMQVVVQPKQFGALPWPTGADEQFCNQIVRARVMSLFGKGELDTEKLGPRLKQCVAQGASVEKSLALHHCASLGQLDTLDVCLSLADPILSAVNAFDPRGMTPLMSAVAPEGFPSNPYKLEQCIDRLISCRADVNLTDAAGLTALGHLWRKAREHLEVDGEDRGLMHAYSSCDLLVDKLMPSNGPTKADEAVRVCIYDHLGLNDSQPLGHPPSEREEQHRRMLEFLSRSAGSRSPPEPRPSSYQMRRHLIEYLRARPDESNGSESDAPDQGEDSESVSGGTEPGQPDGDESLA